MAWEEKIVLAQQKIVLKLIEARVPGTIKAKKETAKPKKVSSVDMPEPTLTPATELQQVLDKKLKPGAKKVEVLYDSNIKGEAVHVTYLPDKNGLIHEVQVRVGAGTKAKHIEDHVPVVREMQKYQGFAGQLRVLRNKVLNFIGVHKLEPGTRAWEAKKEITKLEAIIKKRTALLNGKHKLSSAELKEIKAEIAYLKEQLDYYQEVFKNVPKFVPGKGYVAANYNKNALKVQWSSYYQEQKRILYTKNFSKVLHDNKITLKKADQEACIRQLSQLEDAPKAEYLAQLQKSGILRKDQKKLFTRKETDKALNPDRMRYTFEETFKLHDAGEISSKERAFLNEVNAKFDAAKQFLNLKQLLKEPTKILEEFNLKAFIDEHQIPVKDKNEKSNINKFLQHANKANLPEEHMDILIRYFQGTPRGFSNQLRKNKVDFKQMVQEAEKALGYKAKPASAKLQLSDAQVAAAAANIQQTNPKQLNGPEQMIWHLMDKEKYADLDLHYQRAIRYLITSPTSALDYVNALVSSGISLSQARVIVDEVGTFSSNQRVMESQLRKYIRAGVVSSFGTSARGYNQLLTTTKTMNATNRGQFFETWGKVHLSLPAGAKRLGSRAITIGKKSYTPDEIILLSNNTLMFREYKDYDVTTRLDTYDGQKIKDYEIALTPNHPVVQLDGQSFQLSRAEYIFSNQGASKTNENALKNLTNKYIMRGKEHIH